MWFFFLNIKYKNHISRMIKKNVFDFEKKKKTMEYGKN